MGFTLIELLVTVALLAILVTLSVSAYREYIHRSARAEAKTVLMEAAGLLERHYATHGRYTTDTGHPPALTGLTQSPKQGEARYLIGFAAIDAHSYTLQAVPTEVQRADPCGTLTLTNTGVRGASGHDAVECWMR